MLRRMNEEQHGHHEEDQWDAQSVRKWLYELYENLEANRANIRESVDSNPGDIKTLRSLARAVMNQLESLIEYIRAAREQMNSDAGKDRKDGAS